MFIANSHAFRITYLDQNYMLNSSPKDDIVEYYFLYNLRGWKRLIYKLLSWLLSMGSVGSNGIVLNWNVGYHRVVNHTGTPSDSLGSNPSFWIFASYLTLDKIFYLSKPQVLHLWNDCSNIFLIGYRMLWGIKLCRAFQTIPGKLFSNCFSCFWELHYYHHCSLDIKIIYIADPLNWFTLY